MQPTEDSALLRQYAENHSDEAFATLVTRHVNLVYSIALRSVGNPHAAEEITQAVFIILAKKAVGLRHEKALSSWLFQTTRLTANNFVRSEIRRRQREQEAYMQSVSNESGSDIWSRIAPSLDTAVAGLREKDRQAIVLRFYEGRNLREVGLALGTSEAAAEKRVSRALEKLHRFFNRRGISSTTAIIAGAISANSIQAAPMALAKSVTAVALTKGAAASASTLTLIQGALKIMAWAKVKTVVVVSAGVLLASGAATITVKQIEEHKSENSWRIENVTSDMVRKAAPQVRILPTKFPHSNNTRLAVAGPGIDKCVGINLPLGQIIQLAHDWDPSRVVFADPLPQGSYDFISTLPQGSSEALQRELKRHFGLAGRRETRVVDVLLLQVRTANAPGLKPPIHGGAYFMNNDGNNNRIKIDDQPLWVDQGHTHGAGLANFLEKLFNMPVIDQTGLTGHFSIDLNWKSLSRLDPVNLEALKQTLLDQLGLELVPANMPMKMLVVEKAQ